jgi:hypothetical protein
MELISESRKSWEDAAKNALVEASKSIRNIRSMYVKNFTAEVTNTGEMQWRLDCRILFEAETAV